MKLTEALTPTGIPQSIYSYYAFRLLVAAAAVCARRPVQIAMVQGFHR